MLTKRTCVSGTNIQKVIVDKVGKMNTTDIRIKDKEAVKQYMIYLAMEALVSVKNKPLASAVTISSLSGKIVKSPIILGGESFMAKAVDRDPVLFEPPMLPKSYNMNSKMKEMNDLINQTNWSPKGMQVASDEAIKAARDRGMTVVGVNMSAYFSMESFALSVDQVCKSFGASPSNPLLFVGDGARIHVTPEVRFLCFMFSECLFNLFEKWSYSCY